MKKLLPLVLLLSSGLALGVVAWRAKAPTYSAPPVVEVPEAVPFVLSGAVPADCVALRVQVDGICCGGCAGKLWARARALEPVREVAVDTVLHEVAVVVPRGFDGGALVDALTFDKYSAKLLP
jgi:hypothetical protein